MQTPAQIITDEACAAQKLAEKTALRANRTAAAKRKKDDRAALAQLRLAERAEQATRLKWTEEVLLELVAFVRMVKDDHNDLEEGMMGYTAFGKFLNYNNKRVGEFALLAGVENSFLLTRYRSLMGTWRQVKDYTDVSGSGGLFGALVKFGLSLSLWNTMLDMNGDNPEAIDHGQGDIKDNMDNLYDDSMSDGLVAESNGRAEFATPPIPFSIQQKGFHEHLLSLTPDNHLPFDASTDAEMPPAFVPRRSCRGRHPDHGLTAEELALDPPSSPPHESNPSGSGGLSGVVGVNAPLSRMASPPSPTSTLLDLILPPADLTDPGLQVSSHVMADPTHAPAGLESSLPEGPTEVPQTVVLPTSATPATLARINSTAPPPKKEDQTGSAMLLMMHKSTEQANLWMIEERKRAEENCADDCREAEAKAAAKENAVHKEEHQDVLEAHHLEAAQYEATKLKRAALEVAQEKSCQMHDMAMKAVLRDFGGQPAPLW
ncbi:hypothetical protein PSTG_08361 [Puccinia striiformis f. sp. tritici PST-78]|uniref:Uncharacterized protein n=1 Tax=Puccinia striiformis f. sp. tritici PST-78 TaxID=1165861 RepID=A0A0L0VG54_9BASI|nr:hypothetical protein PSTG_08361 [Puccinia striiformis f. sp. tritici PST-78]